MSCFDQQTIQVCLPGSTCRLHVMIDIYHRYLRPSGGSRIFPWGGSFFRSVGLQVDCDQEYSAFGTVIQAQRSISRIRNRLIDLFCLHTANARVLSTNCLLQTYAVYSTKHRPIRILLHSGIHSCYSGQMKLQATIFKTFTFS